MELTLLSPRPGSGPLVPKPCLLCPMTSYLGPLTQLGPSWATMSPEAGLAGKRKWGLLGVPFGSDPSVT